MNAQRASRALLAVGGLLSGLYAAQLLIDILRPRAVAGEPFVGLLGDLWQTVPKVTFWLVVTGWVVAAGIAIWWRLRGSGSALRFAAAAALLLPLTPYPLSVLVGHPVAVLTCLPTTGLALLGIYRLQRLRRVPLWLFLSVFGWGALIAAGFGASMNIWTMEYSTDYFADGSNSLHTMHNVYTLSFVSAGLFEELGKGTAVLLVYLAFRQYFDGVVSGVVIGAAAGLGFNLAESVEYMTAFNGATAEFQFWIRQEVGIMAAHTAFAAVLGAAFGLARQLDDARLRRIAIAAGYVGAAGAHFANDALLRWWSHAEPHAWSAHPTLDVLVVQPLTLLALQGPFLLLYLLLVRLDHRHEGLAIASALRAEVATGSGAVTEPEIPVLLVPAKRLWLGITMLRRYGWAGYRAVGRLQAAQFDLAARLAHGPNDGPPEGVLRSGVLARRQQLAAVTGVAA